VLDGAYAEFAEGYDGGARLVETRDNVVMTRTFSKVYGLGGLRVGYGYAPREVIEVLTRIRGPFNLSSPWRWRARRLHCATPTGWRGAARQRR
jgi:histidinol-phosphate aminotransferase